MATKPPIIRPHLVGGSCPSNCVCIPSRCFRRICFRRDGTCAGLPHCCPRVVSFHPRPPTFFDQSVSSWYRAASSRAGSPKPLPSSRRATLSCASAMDRPFSLGASRQCEFHVISRDGSVQCRLRIRAGRRGHTRDSVVSANLAGVPQQFVGDLVVTDASRRSVSGTTEDLTWRWS